MLRWLRLLPICMLLFAAPVFAQNDAATGDIILGVDNVIRRYQEGGDGSDMYGIPGCQPDEDEIIVSELVLSPDGTAIAYNLQPALVTQALERVGGVGGGELPTDIVVCDLVTGTQTRVAGQPEDLSFFEEGVPPHVNMHGLPAWSPDSTKLAWSEFGYPSDVNPYNMLMMYDRTSGETTLLEPFLPIRSGVPSNAPVEWGVLGILVNGDLFNEAAQTYTSQMYVYNEFGTRIATFDLPPDSFADDYLWVEFAPETYTFMVQAYGGGAYGWYEANLAGGTLEPTDAVPVLYSAAAPEGYAFASTPLNDTADNLWITLPLREDVPPLQLEYNQTPALAPDGAAFIYQEDLNIFLWRDGVQTNLANMIMGAADPDGRDSVVWSPTAWRMETLVGGVPAATTCPGFLPSRLEAGRQARVIPGLGANILRAEASRSSQRLGTIPENAVFDVLAGPTCADNYAWWQVSYNGQTGWTVEGQGDVYWLEPAS